MSSYDVDESRRRDAANLEGALQTRAIRDGARSRRDEVLARQRAARPLPVRTIRQRLRDAAYAFRS